MEQSQDGGTSAKDWIDVWIAWGWPIAVIIGAISLRRPLFELATHIARRASKVSFGDFAVEFAPLRETAQQVVRGDLQVGRAVQIGDSFAMTLVSQLESSAAGDYAVIDLAEGRDWLTSRIFIFALMLHRTSAVQHFVFVATRNGVKGQYVGTASLPAVRFALAKRYPWFEQAFASAYSAAFGQPPSPPQARIGSETGRIDNANRQPCAYPVAGELINHFLRAIQSPAPVPPQDATNWVQVEQMPQFEHATWVNESLLRSDLNEVLSGPEHALTDTWNLSRDELVRKIVGGSGAAMAILHQGQKFVELIDRRRVLESVAKECVKSN